MFFSNKNQQKEVLFSLEEDGKRQGKRKNINAKNIPTPFALAEFLG